MIPVGRTTGIYKEKPPPNWNIPAGASGRPSSVGALALCMMAGSWRWISLTAARTRFQIRWPSRLPFSSMASARWASIQGHDGTVLLQQPELFAGRLSFSRIGEGEGVNAIESALFDQINWPYLQILVRE